MGIGNDVRARAAAWLTRAQAGPTALPPPLSLPSLRPSVAQAATPVDVAVAVAAALARRFEGLYLKPYLCPAGVPTIGYGATYYEDGTRVQLTDRPITREQAEALLLWMVRRVYLPAVRRQCPGVDNPNRLAALIDFTLNLGESNLRASTLRRRVNVGDWDSARVEVLRWDKAGGRVLRGLTLRRKANAALLANSVLAK